MQSAGVPPLEVQSFFSSNSGPRLLVLGAIHGIEKCGTKAIRSIVDQIRSGHLSLVSGTTTFVPIANPEAYALNLRYVERDLNRGLAPVHAPVNTVDYISNTICDLMLEHDVLLDLHSFRARGSSFVFVGPENNNSDVEPFLFAEEELNLAKSLGSHRLVFGWLSAYVDFSKEQSLFLEKHLDVNRNQVKLAHPKFGRGTTEYFRSLGGKYGVTLECGNHDDPRSIDVAKKAIIGAMSFLKIVAEPCVIKPFEDSYRFTKVFIRESEGDKLSRSYKSFDRVCKGEVLGTRQSGENVIAPTDGALIFVYEDARVASEWIYFAESSDRGI